jgi:hypothetical protein
MMNRTAFSFTNNKDKEICDDMRSRYIHQMRGCELDVQGSKELIKSR